MEYPFTNHITNRQTNIIIKINLKIQIIVIFDILVKMTV